MRVPVLLLNGPSLLVLFLIGFLAATIGAESLQDVGKSKKVNFFVALLVFISIFFWILIEILLLSLFSVMFDPTCKTECGMALLAPFWFIAVLPLYEASGLAVGAVIFSIAHILISRFSLGESTKKILGAIAVVFGILLTGALFYDFATIGYYLFPHIGTTSIPIQRQQEHGVSATSTPDTFPTNDQSRSLPVATFECNDHKTIAATYAGPNTPHGKGLVSLDLSDGRKIQLRLTDSSADLSYTSADGNIKFWDDSRNSIQLVENGNITYAGCMHLLKGD